MNQRQNATLLATMEMVMSNTDSIPATPPPVKGKTYGYVRVSTPDQDVKAQVIALREFGCDKIFKDEGISGRKFDREGLNELLDLAAPGDRIVVQRLDRMGRSVYHMARLLHLFEERDVRFISLTQSMDLKTASGKLMYYIFTAFGEYESNMNGERTKGGMKIRRADGVRLGRKPKLTTNDARTARKMLNSKKLTLESVAGVFDVSKRTLSRALKGLDGEVA